MSVPLAGKVAIVSGAGKNLGRRIALGLAADGAAVVVNGRSDQGAVDSVAAEIRAAGGEALPILADVSKEAEVVAMAEAAMAQFGGIDIVISNAALRQQTPFVEMSFAEWRNILSVPLDGAFLLARNAVASMIDRGGGAIVAISGISHHIGFANRVHLNAAKAGLEGLVRGLAVELASHNISVNAVAPGVIAHDGAPPPAKLPPIAMGRPAHESEVVSLISYLVNPQNAYVTGQTIHVNGGWYLGK